MAIDLEIHSKVAQNAQAEILTEGALQFLAALHRTFDATRQGLLAAREVAQARYDAGAPFDFPPETAHIRAEPSWHCAPPSPGLEDRRVEITGPTDRKMVVNALNSGTKTFMADFEGQLETLFCLFCFLFRFVLFFLAFFWWWWGSFGYLYSFRVSRLERAVLAWEDVIAFGMLSFFIPLLFFPFLSHVSVIPSTSISRHAPTPC